MKFFAIVLEALCSSEAGAAAVADTADDLDDDRGTDEKKVAEIFFNAL